MIALSRCFQFFIWDVKIPLLWRGGENFGEIFDGVVPELKLKFPIE
jgi:hypothetical protein